MRDSKPKQIQIFYDGLCHLCFREMEHYKKSDKNGALEFIDFTKDGFDAKEHGLSPENLNKAMHAKDPNGKVATGIDAFILIWTAFPRYRVLSKLVQSRALNPFFKLGYRLFARARVYLPKRKICNDDRCKR